MIEADDGAEGMKGIILRKRDREVSESTTDDREGAEKIRIRHSKYRENAKGHGRDVI